MHKDSNFESHNSIKLAIVAFLYYFIATFKEIMPFHYNNIKF